jgi:hypothetical protein
MLAASANLDLPILTNFMGINNSQAELAKLLFSGYIKLAVVRL